MSRIGWLAVLISSAAVGHEAELVRVLALADGQNCRVFDQQLACEAVGGYLKDTRHLPAGHSVQVEPGGGKTSIPGVFKAGRSLEAAGYSSLYRAVFISAPPPSSGSKP